MITPPPAGYAHAVAGAFRVVQPWGRDVARQSTLISEHHTAAAAFAEIDRLAAQMVRTGARSDSVQLLVVDRGGRVVPRPDPNDRQRVLVPHGYRRHASSSTAVREFGTTAD